MFKRKLREELLGSSQSLDLQALVEAALVTAEAASYVVSARMRIRQILAMVKELTPPTGENLKEALIQLSRTLTQVVSEAVEEALRAPPRALSATPP